MDSTSLGKLRALSLVSAMLKIETAMQLVDNNLLLKPRMVISKKQLRRLEVMVLVVYYRKCTLKLVQGNLSTKTSAFSKDMNIISTPPF